MEKAYLTIALLISFPEAVLVGLLGLTMLGFKPTLRQVLIIAFIESIFGGLLTTLPIPFGIHTIIQIITFSLLIHFVMCTPYKISLLAILLGVCIEGSLEVVIVPLLIKIMGISFQAVVNNIYLRVAFFFPQALIMIIIILLIRRFRHRSETGQSYKINKTFPLIFLILTQTFLITLLYISSYIDQNDNFRETLISVRFPLIMIIAILPIISIVMIKRVVEMIQNEIETNVQLDSLRNVTELLNTIRSQRHNFSHDLQVAYGLLEVEAFQEAKTYIKESMSEIAATSELIKTDNLGITALLQTKSCIAEARKINLHIEVKTSLRNLPIKTRDINIILGNLIDNAFDAVDQLNVNQKNIKIMMSEDLQGYVFEVENDSLYLDENLAKKVFEPGFSTKGDGRGMGLYSVDRIIKKYGGSVDVVCRPGSTTFKIHLPIKNTKIF